MGFHLQLTLAIIYSYGEINGLLFIEVNKIAEQRRAYAIHRRD
jgi:hypothetical protein